MRRGAPTIEGSGIFLDYFALFMLVFVIIVFFYVIIVVHDIPYEIAKDRDHPHQDAIHAAGWVSLLTLHVMWPFPWIWAMLYKPDRGWGFAQRLAADETELADLRRRVAALEAGMKAGQV